jgi:hypothetical protein
MKLPPRNLTHGGLSGNNKQGFDFFILIFLGFKIFWQFFLIALKKYT